MKKKKEIEEVCTPCGISANVMTCIKRYGDIPLKLCFDVSTFHNGNCDVCGRYASVTQVRDFFYPDFNLISKGVLKDIQWTTQKYE